MTKAAQPKDWYVLWRPPQRPTNLTGVAYLDDEAYAAQPSEWEVYQTGLTRTGAERLANRVTNQLSPRWFGKNVSTRVGQGTPPKQNPPWTTKALARRWSDLEEQVGAAWMPVLAKPHASRKGELVATLEPLGCGAYGCVLETDDPDVVLKVTTDQSEAEFATKVLPKMPESARAGFVRYLDTAPLDSKHERRPLVALWRQAAQDVGKLGSPKGITDRFLGRQRKSLLELVHHSWDAAQVALETLFNADDAGGEVFEEALTAPRWDYDAGADSQDIAEQIDAVGDESERLAAALSYFESANDAMRGTPLERVGQSLNALLEEGVFVGDVHEGNLGRVRGDGSGRDLSWVITDPGNVIILPGPWR